MTFSLLNDIISNWIIYHHWRNEMASHAVKQKKTSALSVLLRILCVLLTTLVLLVILLYFVMYLLCRGPSPTARDLFVRSVRETSAIGFLANLYLSDEEIAEIEKAEEIAVEETDTSLITVKTELSSSAEGHYRDDWGYTDDDDDGLILVSVPGETYTGYMLIVLDPSRVVLGCNPDMLGAKGYTVAQYVEMFDAYGIRSLCKIFCMTDTTYYSNLKKHVEFIRLSDLSDGSCCHDIIIDRKKMNS